MLRCLNLLMNQLMYMAIYLTWFYISEDQNCFDYISVLPLHSLPSDHSAILFNAELSRAAVTKSTIKFRKTREIDHDQFKNDISNSVLLNKSADNLPLMYHTQQYNLVLKELLDKHAPEVSRQISLRPNAP